MAYAGAIAGSAGLTVGLTAIRPSINPTDVALAYLLLILVVAALTTFGPAALACVFATTFFNFNFLPPYGTFTIADPANWFALFAFLVTAAVTSRLVTTARQRSAEAAQRAREAWRLHEFARSLLAIARHEDARDQIVEAVERVLGADACSFISWRDGRVECSPADALLPSVRDVTPHSAPAEPARLPVGTGGCLVLVPVRVGAVPQALAAYFADSGIIPPKAILAALGSLATLALERVRLIESALEAEMVRKSEALKTALLSSVSHDVRTPLAAARVAATALQDEAVWNDRAMRAELLATLDEGTARLNRAVGNLLYMSRIEAGELQLQLRPCSVSEIVAEAMEVVGPRRLRERLQVDISGDTPPVAGDIGLLATAVANLLDNALKYAPAATRVEITGGVTDQQVTIAIRDRGPGIPAGEEEAVFTAFRRGTRRPRHAGDPGGVGLGLSIVRALVEAHGGSVSIRRRRGGGTEVAVALPALAARPVEASRRV